MTEQGDIEFVAEPGGRILDPRVDGLPPTQRRRRGPVRPTVSALVASVLLLAAVVLCAVAPFTRVSRLTEGFSDPTTFRRENLSLTTDGWGRRHLDVHNLPGVFASDIGVGTRSGIAFTVAGVLLLAVVPLLVFAGRRIAEMLAVAAAALTVGALGVVALDLLNQHQTFSANPEVHDRLAIGPCLWLGAVAALFAVAAALTLVVPGARHQEDAPVQVTPAVV